VRFGKPPFHILALQSPRNSSAADCDARSDVTDINYTKRVRNTSVVTSLTERLTVEALRICLFVI
jgi:hypothetical protein